MLLEAASRFASGDAGITCGGARIAAADRGQTGAKFRERTALRCAGIKTGRLASGFACGVNRFTGCTGNRFASRGARVAATGAKRTEVATELGAETGKRAALRRAGIKTGRFASRGTRFASDRCTRFTGCYFTGRGARRATTGKPATAKSLSKLCRDREDNRDGQHRKKDTTLHQ